MTKQPTTFGEALVANTDLHRLKGELDSIRHIPFDQRIKRRQIEFEIKTLERTELEDARQNLAVAESMLMLQVNEVKESTGKGRDYGELLRQANLALAQAKDRLEVEKSRLVLQVNQTIGEDGKPKYGSEALRSAALTVDMGADQAYQTALATFRAAEDNVARIKQEADEAAAAAKPKYGNDTMRKAALTIMMRDSVDYQAAYNQLRRVEEKLAKLRERLQECEDNIKSNAELTWTLRTLVDAARAEILAVATFDGPIMPAEITVRAPEQPMQAVVIQRGPLQLEVVHVGEKKGAA